MFRLCHSWFVVAMLLAAAVAGCQKWNWRGQGYDETTNSMTDNLRPGANEKQFTGFDARARDIERSLGVR